VRDGRWGRSLRLISSILGGHKKAGWGSHLELISGHENLNQGVLGRQEEWGGNMKKKKAVAKGLRPGHATEAASELFEHGWKRQGKESQVTHSGKNLSGWHCA